VTELPSTRPGGWDDPTAPVPAPLALHRTQVRPAWVDYNGHMTEWAYLLVMGDGSDAFFRYIGIDEAYRGSGRSLYTVETHIRNLREAALGDELSLTLRVLGVDAKRVHVAHEVRLAEVDADTHADTHADADVDADDALIATGEQLLLHVDTAAARTSPLPEVLHQRLARIATAHAALPVPAWVGSAIRTPGRG
jgi:acyl-CoA thioester hydrolase